MSLAATLKRLALDFGPETLAIIGINTDEVKTACESGGEER